MPSCPNCGHEFCTTRAGITPKQRKVFNFIREHIDENGCSPSFQEIADACGMKSKSQVHRQVHTLVERGWLEAHKIFGKRVICRSVSVVEGYTYA